MWPYSDHNGCIDDASRASMAPVSREFIQLRITIKVGQDIKQC